MKLKPVKLVPALIALSVIVFVAGLRWLRVDFFERLELITYDMRVRAAAARAPTVATNLGFVFIEEESLAYVRTNRHRGFHFGLAWPRQIYGRLVDELAEQGAKAIAFDIVFGDLRDDHPPVRMGDGTNIVDSDEFFAVQLRRAGNVILAVTKEVTPPASFATNAMALGDITAESDGDGILRRAQVFKTYRQWHLAFQQVEADPGFGIDLDKARVEPRQIVLARSNGEVIRVPLDENGCFDLADFVGENIPPGMARRAKPFTTERRWHTGVLLAAQELQLDLDHAEVDLSHGRITLRGAGGVRRVIPVDAQGRFEIDWALPPNHPALTQEPIQSLLEQNCLRSEGRTGQLTNRWRGKLAVIGSAEVVGNNLTDRGSTPLSQSTLLVSKHWNVANSIILGRFVRRAPLAVELALIALLGILAAVLTWELRPVLASISVAVMALAYVAFGVVLYIQTRFWIPLALPVFGALLMTHVCLVTWRVVFEEAAKRRVRSIFSTMVSPKVVNELLKSEKLSLGGARREVTVMFSDVRGFTQFTDVSQEQVAEFVGKNRLTGAAAEACFDEQARETLATINLYLGVVAGTVLKHDGLLDKFIGDCVMAFWGAPTPAPGHATACVRAAIEAQRAIFELNQQRERENQQRERENVTRTAGGLAPRPLLPTLALGSGINTGMATVGLMGVEAKAGVRQVNYTVFGREVNLASRLESLSGHGRIFISETTHRHLVRDDPALAATCQALPPVKVKGIASEVNVYEVPWKAGGTPAAPQVPRAAAASTAGS